MIPTNDAELRAYNANLARMKAQGTVRTHRLGDKNEVAGIDGRKSSQGSQKQPRQGANGGEAVPKARSSLEIALQAQIESAGLPKAEYDVPYLIGTRHRIDVCWRDKRLGVEVQGMVHRIKGRFKADITKRATALLQGWTVLEVDGEAINSGKAIEWIGQLLKR